MTAGSSQPVRFIHSSDWHLGATRSFLNDDAQARWVASRFEAIRRLGQLAREEEAEFLVVAGDVFESNQVDRRTVLRACEALATVPVPVFLLPGNHDPLDDGTVFNSSSWNSNKPDCVQVLSDPKQPHEVRPGIEVLGAPWFTKRPLSDQVADSVEAMAPVAGVVRVFVAHGATDTLAPDRENPALIHVDRVEAALADGRIHYLALGDRHSPTEVGPTGRIWYSGTPEVYAFNEEDPGHALLVEIGECSRRIQPLRVGAWQFLNQDVDIGSSGDVDAIKNFLDSIDGKERTVVRLALVGTVTLRDHARLTELIDQANDLFAGVHQSGSRSDLVVVPDDADFDDLSLGGFAATAVEKLRAVSAGEGAEAEQARDGLALLVRLARAE